MAALVHKKPDGTEKIFEAGDKPLIIGRLPESEIQVHDSFLSRVHCGIAYYNHQFHLKDLGSTNGTYRNGARVFQCPLVSGDRIQVGNTTLIFELDPTNGHAVLRHCSPAETAPTASRLPGVISPTRQPL